MNKIGVSTRGTSNLNSPKYLIRLLALFSLILVLSFAAGCQKDDEVATDQLTMEDYLERGWESYNDRNYLAALTDFQAVIDIDATVDDAWNGAGWSAGQLESRLNEAENHFQQCLSLNSLKYDAHGGLIFVLYQKSTQDTSLLTDVLTRSDRLLNAKPRWRFVHDQTIDFNDIRLITAVSHYNQQNFEQAFDLIKTYLNPNFETDWNTPNGQREILEELERLRQIYG